MSHNIRQLVVDLDGTLIHTDMLHEFAIHLLRDKPYFVLAIPFWLLRGKAMLKQKLASHIDADIASLPFNQNLIDWLQSQKDLGRKLVLCTATDMSIAKMIAILLTTISYSFINLSIAKPNAPGLASNASFGFFIEHGVLVKDVFNRLKLIDCANMRCYESFNEY